MNWVLHCTFLFCVSRVMWFWQAALRPVEAVRGHHIVGLKIQSSFAGHRDRLEHSQSNSATRGVAVHTVEKKRLIVGRESPRSREGCTLKPPNTRLTRLDLPSGVLLQVPAPRGPCLPFPLAASSQWQTGDFSH
ncbi:hypothetical protein BDW62DRAFT_192811 [Aspergillus aurantiobrunneus]